jgi:hypothetical protein
MVKDQIKLNTSRKGYSIVIKSENQALEKIKKLRIVKKMKKITKIIYLFINILIVHIKYFLIVFIFD